MKAENYGDIMFYEFNFEIMFFTLVSSTMSAGIIVNVIRPLSTGIIVYFYIS